MIEITDEMVNRAYEAGSPPRSATYDPAVVVFDLASALAAVAPLIEAQARERALREAAANVAKIQPYYYTQTGYKDHPAGAFVLQTDVLRALIGAPQQNTEIKP